MEIQTMENAAWPVSPENVSNEDFKKNKQSSNVVAARKHKGFLMPSLCNWAKFNFSTNSNSKNDMYQESIASYLKPKNKCVPSDVTLLAGDECEHCAQQGLDMISRESKIHRTSNELTKHGYICAFHAKRQMSCEFKYCYSYFLSEIPNGELVNIPMKLSECSNNMPHGTRVRLRLNDHLRGEEGVRGWLLLIEGNTIMALFKAVDVVNNCGLGWNIWGGGMLGLEGLTS